MIIVRQVCKVEAVNRRSHLLPGAVVVKTERPDRTNQFFVERATENNRMGPLQAVVEFREMTNQSTNPKSMKMQAPFLDQLIHNFRVQRKDVYEEEAVGRWILWRAEMRGLHF